MNDVGFGARHRGEIRIDRTGAELARQRFGARAIAVANADHFDERQRVQRAQVVRGDVTGADQADANFGRDGTTHL